MSGGDVDGFLSPSEMKFDFVMVYEKDDFLMRLAYFAETCADVPEIVRFCEQRICWAESQPEGTKFGWWEDEFKVRRPRAIIEMVTEADD